VNILFVLVPLSLALVVVGGWAFWWAVDNGQFDELTSSSWDALLDEEPSAGSGGRHHV
jgi:cbb3-type cytochrome oxidase maturation protein